MLRRKTQHWRWLERGYGPCAGAWCTEYANTWTADSEPGEPDHALRAGSHKVVVLLTDGMPNRNCQKCGMKHGNRVDKSELFAQRCANLAPRLSTWEDGVPGGVYNPLNGLSHFGGFAHPDLHRPLNRRISLVTYPDLDRPLNPASASSLTLSHPHLSSADANVRPSAAETATAAANAIKATGASLITIGFGDGSSQAAQGQAALSSLLSSMADQPSMSFTDANIDNVITRFKDGALCSMSPNILCNPGCIAPPPPPRSPRNVNCGPGRRLSEDGESCSAPDDLWDDTIDGSYPIGCEDENFDGTKALKAVDIVENVIVYTNLLFAELADNSTGSAASRLNAAIRAGNAKEAINIVSSTAAQANAASTVDASSLANALGALAVGDQADAETQLQALLQQAPPPSAEAEAAALAALAVINSSDPADAQIVLAAAIAGDNTSDTAMALLALSQADATAWAADELAPPGDDDPPLANNPFQFLRSFVVPLVQAR